MARYLNRDHGLSKPVSRDFEYEIFLNGIEDELSKHQLVSTTISFDETIEQIKWQGLRFYQSNSEHLDPDIHAFVPERFWDSIGQNSI